MILHRYILRELVVSFAFTFVVIMIVCLVGTTFQIFRSFQGLGFDLLPKMAPYAAGYVAPWALLVASCTSTTLVYGRLTAENEIDAMRMSGIHTNRIIAPALVFGLLLTAGGYALIEHATPAAGEGRKKLIRDSLTLFLKLPPPGQQQFKIGPFHLSYMNYRGGRMEEIDLMKWGKDPKTGIDRLEMEFHASSGRAEMDETEPPRIVLDFPSSAVRYHENGTVDRFTEEEKEIVIPLEIEGVTKKEKKPEHLRRRELLKLRERTTDPHDRAEIETMLHTRVAQTLAPLLLVMVSVPIGIFVKRGARLAGLGAALPPLVLYLVIFFIFQGMGDKGRVPPAFAAYAPDAVLAAVSAALLVGVYRK